MKENNIKGTLIIWPGIAEEQLGSKAGMLEMDILMTLICVFSLT